MCGRWEEEFNNIYNKATHLVLLVLLITTHLPIKTVPACILGQNKISTTIRVIYNFYKNKSIYVRFYQWLRQRLKCYNTVCACSE